MIVLLLRPMGFCSIVAAQSLSRLFFALLGYFSSFSKKPPSERPTEEVGLEQALRHGSRSCVIGQAAPEQVSWVRGNAGHLALLAIEREGIVPCWLQPVALFHDVTQCACRLP